MTFIKDTNVITISFIIFALFFVLLLSGCAHNSLQQYDNISITDTKYDLNIALLISDETRQAKDEVSGGPKPYYYEHDTGITFERNMVNLAKKIFRNAQVFYQDDVLSSNNVDGFLIPTIYSFSSEPLGFKTGFMKTKSKAWVGIRLLDKNMNEIFQTKTEEEAVGMVGASFNVTKNGIKRADDAIYKASVKLYKKLLETKEFQLFIMLSDFFNSTEDNQVAMFEETIQDIAYADHLSDINQFVLHYSVMNNKVLLAQKALDNGADINRSLFNDNWSFPILTAARNNRIEILKLLIEYGADLNQKTQGGDSALYYAVWNGFYDFSELLLDHDASFYNIAEETKSHYYSDLEKARLYYDIALIYNYFGNYFARSGKTDKALFCFEQSMDFFKKDHEILSTFDSVFRKKDLTLIDRDRIIKRIKRKTPLKTIDKIKIEGMLRFDDRKVRMLYVSKRIECYKNGDCESIKDDNRRVFGVTSFYGTRNINMDIDYLNKSIEMDATSADAYIDRGVYFLRKGLFLWAHKDFNKAIVIDPMLADAYNYRGRLLLLKFFIEGAKGCKDLKKACELGNCTNYYFLLQKGDCL